MDAINQLRLERALSSMNEAFKHVYGLLPVLLNYHHPMLPGYIEGNVPSGVCFFVPDVHQIHWLKQFESYFFCELPSQQINDELPITGIYSMGSTSSIGQNDVSDLDIWVCHQSWLDQEEKQLMQKKCILIEQWASLIGIDVTFFLIDENRFRHHTSASLSNKDCKTTQHVLLLDEFYRTAVRMAGKRLLWMMVPAEEETNYNEYVLLLYARGVLTPNEWLDLGGLSELSAEEYFCASLWQLHKSVDSPYKAVLKSILLEAYFWNYPRGMLLAMEFKQCLHAGEIVSYGLDAYCLMLERVTRYLMEINDFKRLDLIRRCFYFKVCEKLSCKNKASVSDSWRRNVLSQLVLSWGWNMNRLNILDKQNFWKIAQARDVDNELLDTMMQSYRNLIRFAHRNNLRISTTP
ncbi:MAG: class I adenylate cyclase [Arsenophonus sp. NC-CH8-MAG3]